MLVTKPVALRTCVRPPAFTGRTRNDYLRAVSRATKCRVVTERGGAAHNVAERGDARNDVIQKELLQERHPECGVAGGWVAEQYVAEADLAERNVAEQSG
jgi:hypothetical protein